ncbi:Ig-like domain (group 2) [Lachnospiraceae bacterium KHCPX20]|nr:Ig-like domain (group 2) [Lachnospiraceae bacterium KHCPX20]
MANFKKGIALALVATTAFTFAPVANLGTPVVAEAAPAAITSLASTSINVAKGSNSVVIINGVDYADTAAVPTQVDAAGNAVVPATTGLTATTAEDDANNNNKQQVTISATGAVAPGTYYFQIKTSSSDVKTLTVNVLDATFANLNSASVLPNEAIAVTLSNLSTGDITVTGTNGENINTGSDAQFTVTKTGDATSTTREVRIVPVAGNIVPGSYTLNLVNGGATETVGITVKPYDIGSTVNLDLGLGQTGDLYFKDAAAGTYTVAGQNNNVAASVAATAQTVSGEDYAKVTVTAASSVGGSQSYTVTRNSNSANIANINVKTSDKSVLTGAVDSATVVVGNKTSLVTVASGVSDFTAANTQAVDAKGDKQTITGYTLTFAPAGIASADTLDATHATIKGDVAGSTVATLTAFKGGSTAAANKIAEKKINVTVTNAPSLAITDAKGNALSTNAPLKLDLLKDTTATVNVTKPEGTTATFKSGNESVATVDANGVVTAKGVGRATITVSTSATATVAALTKTFDVVVAAKPANNIKVVDDKNVALTDVTNIADYPTNSSVKALKLNLLNRKEATVTTASEASDAQITYTTTSNYFTVDRFTGKVATKANVTGTGIIDVFVTETATTAAAHYQVYVTVTEKPEDEISVTSDNVKLVKGKTVSLGAKSAAGATLTYVSSDPAKVTVDAAGTLTAVATGTANVTITAAATQTTIATRKVVTVTVQEFPDNTIVVKNGSDVVEESINIKDATELTITADASAKVTAVSLNKDIVNISEKDGVFTLTPNKEGSAVIQIDAAAVANKYAATTRYLVVNYGKELTKITADASVSVETGKTAQITATTTPADAVLTYTSSDETVATVDAATGLVTGVKAGVAIVTVSAADGAKAIVAVNVTAPVKKINKPAQVTGVKVVNVKGAKAKVTFKKSKKAVGYVVVYKVGKKTYKKTIYKNAVVISVKKGATVKVTVKAFNYKDGNVQQFAKASKTVSKKTDKK